MRSSLNRINRLERDLKESETRRLYVESQVQDLQGKLNTADNQRKHWEDEAKVSCLAVAFEPKNFSSPFLTFDHSFFRGAFCFHK